MDSASKVGSGSQLAVEQPRMDFIAWTAGTGQHQSFSAREFLGLNDRSTLGGVETVDYLKYLLSISRMFSL